MGKKKVFIITIALLLVVGTGSFVFAGEGDQKLDVDNRTNSDQQVTPVPKVETVETPVPVIKPSVPEEPTENDDNNSDNTNNSSASRPGTSGNGSSSTTKPTTPSNKPDVEQPTTPSNPNDNNGNTGSENKPQEPDKPVIDEKPTSTLKVVSIETSNNNKPTFEPVSVTIKFNEPIKGVNEGGWTSKDNDLTRIKVNITKNGTYKIIAYDKNEKALEITYEVKNYHPAPKITTNIDENGVAKVTIKSEDDLGKIKEWVKETNGTYTKILEENENLTYLNIDGENVKIDYTKPELNVSTSNVENGISMPANKATITIESKSGKELVLPTEEGWTLSEDKLSIYKVVTSNVEGNITILDVEENTVVVKYKTEYIYNATPVMNGLRGKLLTDDNTKASLSFSTNSRLKEAPQGWKGDSGMQRMSGTFALNQKVIVRLIDLWGNEAYYYIIPRLNTTTNKVEIEKGLASDTEISEYLAN